MLKLQGSIITEVTFTSISVSCCWLTPVIEIVVFGMLTRLLRAALLSRVALIQGPWYVLKFLILLFPEAGRHCQPAGDCGALPSSVTTPLVQ